MKPWLCSAIVQVGKVLTFSLFLISCSFTTDIDTGREKYTYTFQVCREIGGGNSGLVQKDQKTQKSTVVGRINETHVASGSKTSLFLSSLSSLFCGPSPTSRATPLFLSWQLNGFC